MEIDPAEHEGSMHRIVTSLVAPRPIGWISSVDGDGADNLAPFSYYNAVSAHPPIVVFSAGDRDGRPKDTPRNVLETEEFVANLVTEDLGERMDHTAADPDGSEFDEAGLTRAESMTVEPPRVAEAHACLECTLRESVRLPNHTAVFGDVQHVYVDESITTDGKVDTFKIDAVGRLGGPFYTGVDVLDLRRRY